MSEPMSQESLKEYVPQMRSRYAAMKTKTARSLTLDDFCEISGFERKYAIRVLGGTRRCSESVKKVGAPVKYGPVDVAVLVVCWEAMERKRHAEDQSTGKA